MPQMCAICGKIPVRGHHITRRGKAKREGGIGKKTTGIARRKFRPNLQRIRVVLPAKGGRTGHTARLNVCTVCIRSGKVIKPGIIARPRKDAVSAPVAS